MKFRLTAWSVVSAVTLSLAILLPAEVAEADNSTDPLIAKYIEASKTQQAYLRDSTMDVKIDAEIPKWHKSGTLNALRIVSKLGKITYDHLLFSGDKEVQKEVVARFLNLETHPPDGSQSYAIVPENYKFKYRGVQDQNGRRVHVLQVSPRKKRENLFKGEIWLDEKTYMPVHEEGKFVKSPLFVKSIEFSRDYELQDGVAVPSHYTGKVDTRVVGPAQIAVQFSHFSRGEPTAAAGPDAADPSAPPKAQSP